MTELIDNAVQLTAVLFCGICSYLLAAKHHKPAYRILTCYYGALAMGILYWLTYDLLTSYTPQIFYVSDLCWMASYLFLLMLVLETATQEERSFSHPAAWLSPAVSTALTLFYCQWGDILENIIWCGLMGAAGFYAIRGAIWARRLANRPRYRFHLTVLFLILTEYCLWTASCFWISDTMTNPYFWFDYTLTAMTVLLLYAAERTVGE